VKLPAPSVNHGFLRSLSISCAKARNTSPIKQNISPGIMITNAPILHPRMPFDMATARNPALVRVLSIMYFFCSCLYIITIVDTASIHAMTMITLYNNFLLLIYRIYYRFLHPRSLILGLRACLRSLYHMSAAL